MNEDDINRRYLDRCDSCLDVIYPGERATNIGDSIDVILICERCLPWDE